MATKYYGINDKWTDDSLVNVIEVASENGTVSSVKVNGVDYGGGGGGSTATVTVSNATYARSLIVKGPIVHNGVVIFDANEMGTVSYNMGESGDVTVLLAESGSELWFNYLSDFASITVTGDITKAGGDHFIVTGNGTITV